RAMDAPKVTATIINDAGSVVTPKPSLFVTDPSVLEGDSGTTAATFTVSLAPASTSTVTVKYSTADSTATAGSDYVAVPSTTLTFAPGQTSQPVTVTVNGDVAHEGPEKFLVKLATASGATIADAQATGTITDNESAITFSVGDLAVLEGNNGTGTGTFTVTASSAPVTGQAVSVKYATADGTATAGSDY